MWNGKDGTLLYVFACGAYLHYKSLLLSANRNDPEQNGKVAAQSGEPCFPPTLPRSTSTSRRHGCVPQNFPRHLLLCCALPGLSSCPVLVYRRSRVFLSVIPSALSLAAAAAAAARVFLSSFLSPPRPPVLCVCLSLAPRQWMRKERRAIGLHLTRSHCAGSLRYGRRTAGEAWLQWSARAGWLDRLDVTGNEGERGRARRKRADMWRRNPITVTSYFLNVQSCLFVFVEFKGALSRKL